MFLRLLLANFTRPCAPIQLANFWKLDYHHSLKVGLHFISIMFKASCHNLRGILTNFASFEAVASYMCYPFGAGIDVGDITAKVKLLLELESSTLDEPPFVSK